MLYKTHIHLGSLIEILYIYKGHETLTYTYKNVRRQNKSE